MTTRGFRTGAGANARMTFDRYILRSFAHILGVCLVATFGLMVIIDLLENLDDFIANNGTRGPVALVQSIGQYYFFQSIFFLDRAGPSLTVLSVMVVLILFQRSGELTPLLAAGVSMYRIAFPLVLAAIVMNGLLVVNQELVVPRVAFAAYEARGGSHNLQLKVEPVYDHATRISIDGRSLHLAERTVKFAEFVLPAPTIAEDLTILKTEKAVFIPGDSQRPPGWYLPEATPKWGDLRLTDRGREIISPGPTPDSLFVATAVTCDQLYKRSSSFTLLSTHELMQRIHSPAFGLVSVHRLIVHLHGRFVEPVVNVMAVLVAIPLMVRRESPGLVVDSSLCGFVLGLLFGLGQVMQYLAQTRMVTPDVAAWVPVIVGGMVAAWLAGVIRT